MVNNINTDTIMRLRFAYSPLVELTLSYRVLHSDWQHALYRRWKEEAKRAIYDLDLPYMSVLIKSEGKKQKDSNGTLRPMWYVPDFLTPTPIVPVTDIETDFERLKATPDSVIREGILTLLSYIESHPVCDHFLADPQGALDVLLAELRMYWKRTLADQWARMQSVLENDVLHYSRVLTLYGAETLFSEIDDGLTYDEGLLSLEHHKKFRTDAVKKPLVSFDDDDKLLYLVPLIFAANTVYHQIQEPWESMILYTPRGVGLWNYEKPPTDAALEIALGTGKARLLQVLATPMNTGELAQSLSLTAGAVSQQLKRLHQAGLVESHRIGKRVYYRLTPRGRQLLMLFD